MIGISARRRLCVGVDDYGLHGGIDDAALHLVELGRVQSIGCMVGVSRWREAARRLAPLIVDTGLRDRPDLGLHLDLTESPLDAGLRRSHPRLLFASYLRHSDRARIRREIDAQLDAFEQATGRAPDFVDGHQHVHQLPGVRDALLDALQTRARATNATNATKPWLRSTRRPVRNPLTPTTLVLAQRFKPALIERLGNGALCELAQAAGYRHNASLLGIYGFDSDATGYARRLGAWLACAGDGDQLMCHPGRRLEAADPIAAARAVEYAVLSGPVFAELMAREKIELVPMSVALGLRGSTRIPMDT